ncbi:MAG: ATP-binding protein [Propionibacterium sp.]
MFDAGNRNPSVWFDGQLQFTRRGVVTATWILTPIQRGRTFEDKKVVVEGHRALFRSLVGREFLLRGSLVWSDPVTVVDRMIDQIPLDERPAWVEECDATLDQLADIPLGARLWTLTVPLSVGGAGALQTTARAAVADLIDTLGLPPARPSDAELKVYRDKAARIGESLFSAFKPRPATVAENVWMLRNASLRGWSGDIDPTAEPALAAELTTSGQASIGEPHLDEGGLTDLDGKPVKNVVEALRRRILKVSTAEEVTTYQAGIVLAQEPPSGMLVPGSEYLGALDETGFFADIAIRGRVISNHEARRKNKRAGNQQNDQASQIGDEVDLSFGLHEAARLLDEYQATLVHDQQEVEVQAIVMVSLASSTFEDADAQARDFIESQASADYTWHRPIGAQEEIFWAMQPWQNVGIHLRSYTQVGPASSFAAAAPIITHQLGTTRGSLLGINTATMLASPVLLDLFGDARADVSPAIAFAAELGAGKSLAQKKITGDAVDRLGARFVAVDTSPIGEWVALAQDLAIDTAVIDVLHPTLSFDPLRVFGASGGRAFQSFLTSLLNVSATSREGSAIAQVTKRAYLEQHGLTSAGDVYAHLASGDATLDMATEIARRIEVFIDIDDEASLGRVIFDGSLPALDPTCRGIVIRTYGVELPSRDELTYERQFDSLSIEKIFGRAFYALAMRAVKEICFADRCDPALFNADEFQRFTISPEAHQAAVEFIRDGRKNLAALTAGTHNPMDDLGDSTLRGLFGVKVAMRHRDLKLAAASAEWLGRAGDMDLIKRIQGLSPRSGMDQKVPADRRGEAIMVDSLGRLGQIRILPPARETRFEATRSTPPEAALLNRQGGGSTR